MNNQRVLIDKEITSMNLDALMHDDIIVLIIHNYIDEKRSDQLVRKMVGDGHWEKYTHEVLKGNHIEQDYFGVDRLGIPFNSTYNNENEAKETYYKNSGSSISKLRSYCDNHFSPIDKLRLELDENYNEGARVANFEGRKMLAGIGRFTTFSQSYLGSAQPHFDALPEKFEKFDSQFAANIYLQVPNDGGELEIWDVEALKPLSSPPEDWRSQLPKSITIKPQKGDLILFNCRKPHAVSSFSSGNRVSLQTFIGCKKKSSLKIWN